MILLILGLACFLAVCFLRPTSALYLIVLFLPAYQVRFTVWKIPMTFLEAMILLLFTVEIFRRPKLKIDRFTIFFISLFLASAAIAVFISPVRVAAAGIFKAYFVEAVMFYFLTRVIITDEKKFRGLLDSLSLLVLYLSLFGLYQFLTLANLSESWWAVEVAGRRITSLVNHPNALALLLGPILALLIMPRAVSDSSPFRSSAALLGLLTLFLTFSRGAWLALGAALVIFGFFTHERKKILTWVLLAAILLAAIPITREKLKGLVVGRDLSQENRYVLWEAARDLIKKRPISGVGLMGFHEYYKNYPLGPDRVVQNYPHNFFLNFWLETGLPGLIAMVGLLILFYKKIRLLYRRKWAYALPVAAAMSVVLLHGLIDVPYLKNDLSVLFWLLYALPDLGLAQVGLRLD